MGRFICNSHHPLAHHHCKQGFRFFCWKKTTKYKPFGLKVANKISTFFCFICFTFIFLYVLRVLTQKWGARISAIVMQQWFQAPGPPSPPQTWVGECEGIRFIITLFWSSITRDYTRSDSTRILYRGYKWGIIPWSSHGPFRATWKFAHILVASLLPGTTGCFAKFNIVPDQERLL